MPANGCGAAADGSGRSGVERCGRSAWTLPVGAGSVVATGVSSLAGNGTVPSALAVCGAACGRTGKVGTASHGEGTVAAGGGAVTGALSAETCAGAATTACGARGCCCVSGSDAVASSGLRCRFLDGKSFRLRAASIDDYCWRDRSGSTSAGLVASVHSAWRDSHRRRVSCGPACADSAAIKTRVNIADDRIALRPGMRPPPTLYNDVQLGFETKVSDADWKW